MTATFHSINPNTGGDGASPESTGVAQSKDSDSRSLQQLTDDDSASSGRFVNRAKILFKQLAENTLLVIETCNTVEQDISNFPFSDSRLYQ